MTEANRWQLFHLYQGLRYTALTGCTSGLKRSCCRPPWASEGVAVSRMAALLTTLEEQNCNLSQVKVNEMFCFVRNVAPKISSDDNMPGIDGATVLVSETVIHRLDSLELLTHHVGPCFRSNSFFMYAATSWRNKNLVSHDIPTRTKQSAPHHDGHSAIVPFQCCIPTRPSTQYQLHLAASTLPYQHF
jgi:hypothetical protein